MAILGLIYLKPKKHHGGGLNSMQFESKQAERLFRAAFHLHRVTQDRIFAVVQVRAVLRRAWPPTIPVYDPKTLVFCRCEKGQWGVQVVDQTAPIVRGDAGHARVYRRNWWRQ
jgi:hypothetical protein